jgi:rSAM/selenodomain-associated transferase 1
LTGTLAVAPRRRLILFAKAPTAGTVKTRLSPPLAAEAAAVLAAAFLKDEVAAFGRIPGVQLSVAYAPRDACTAFRRLLGDRWMPWLSPQSEGDLGERLSAAFAGACPSWWPVAIAGADTPDLPPAWIERAFAVLERGAHDLVLGPTVDGGYYLVAARQPYPALFAGIPWSTSGVLAATLESARRQALRVHLLPLWEDIDTGADLDRLRRRLAVDPGAAPATGRALAELGLALPPAPD